MTLSYHLSELSDTAKKIIESNPHKIILFNAEMGAGKTTLIKEICKQLGVEDTITSPTFSLVNAYETKDSLLYHFDFYRIKNEEEAYDIGFEEYLESNAWIFIEWPDKIRNFLPKECTAITIEVEEKNNRVLTILNS